MKKIILLTLSITFSLQSHASPLPQTKAEFCARFKSEPNQRINIQELALETTNLFSFKNTGGLMSGGVCWWHSRFQRNILYLTIFRPSLPKVGTEETKKLIHQIRLGSSVVSIPGFANFSDFSKENKNLIQSELNAWQIYDGFVLGSWIDGLKGKTKLPADELSKLMDKVYQYVGVDKKIAWEKLQLKGITSHAWLIVDIKKLDDGYDMGIIDSNNPRMSTLYSYRTGDISFFIKGYGDFIPYLEFKREEEKITVAGEVFCGMKGISSINHSDERASYKRDLEDARRSR
jgi:hypothetical protein